MFICKEKKIILTTVLKQVDYSVKTVLKEIVRTLIGVTLHLIYFMVTIWPCLKKFVARSIIKLRVKMHNHGGFYIKYQQYRYQSVDK